MLPARKLLFLIDHLAKVAKRQDKETTLSHIRIAVVREVEPKDEHRSIFVMTRETNDGPEKLAITYHRPPTSRAADYNGGKVTVDIEAEKITLKFVEEKVPEVAPVA